MHILHAGRFIIPVEAVIEYEFRRYYALIGNKKYEKIFISFIFICNTCCIYNL